MVLNKLAKDTPMFSRPSAPSHVCFVFDETTVTDRIIASVKHSILDSGNHHMKIAFVGLDKASIRKVKKELWGKGFAIGFQNGSEDAKEWLMNESVFPY